MKSGPFIMHRRQKQTAWSRARFWITHASHWAVLLGFVVITLSLLYTLWGNDAAFAATMFGQ